MRKKAVKVKVRKWVTCLEPGCKKRATVKSSLCGEHQKKFENKIAADEAARRKKPAKRKTDPKRIECLRFGCARRALDKSPFCGPHAKKHKEAVDLADRRIKEKTEAAVKGSVKMTRARQAIPSPASRLIKAHCEKCHYTIRLSRKWIDVKRPLCPVCVKNMVTELDGLIDADPRQLPLKNIKKAKKKGGV